MLDKRQAEAAADALMRVDLEAQRAKAEALNRKNVPVPSRAIDIVLAFVGALSGLVAGVEIKFPIYVGVIAGVLLGIVAGEVIRRFRRAKNGEVRGSD